MSTPRHILLRAPHMAHLLDHPALEAMDDALLQSLEAFMSFCADEGLDVPDEIDLHAFAQLRSRAPEDLENLAAALEALGMEQIYSETTHEVARSLRHRADFNGICKGPRRDYARSVSLPSDALPADWQETLRRLRANAIFAPSILERMENRLCMFAYSAHRHGHPLELGHTEALKAFYDDLRARSALKNDGEPRWAYLRSAWEELRRFARAHNLSGDVLAGLTMTYEVLGGLERQQTALKFTKLREAGTASGLLGRAETRLARAGAAALPHLRHARRNAAVAIALGVVVPARPGDVQLNHVLGNGIFFEPALNAYRFCYVPKKTRRSRAEELDIQLQPYWNQFLDALILQDQHPRYLDELRAKAFAEQRPLYVNYDGSPCRYGWYSSVWRRVARTGGHIARTLIYDEFADLGEAGIQYARGVNHHLTGRIPDKYRSRNAIRKSYGLAQSTMMSRADDDDISDLL